MANHYNKVQLIGNLTRDPDLETTSNNNSVSNVGIAINRDYKSNGEWKEDTTFVDITAWGSTAEALHEYQSKGDKIFVDGRLNLDQWEDEGGNKKSKLSVTAEKIIFLGGGNSGGEQSSSDQAENSNSGQDVPF